MSGYLARLVASVSNGRSAIHPRVASPFAMSAEPSGLPVIEEEEEPAPRAHIDDAPTTSLHLQREVGEALTEPGTTGIVRSASNPTALRAAERRPEAPHAPLTPLHPDAEPASPASGQTHRESQPTADPPRLTPQGGEEVPVAASYTPLVIIDTLHGAPPPAPTPLQPRRRPISAAGEAPTAAREPDEVHIHIGRIEVTAAAPSAPIGPPVRPPRKSPSLDEYLKRGRR